MTTEVLLVRHGSHDRLGRILCGRMAGVTLSPNGRREADRLATELLREERVDAVYASPLERARETAEPMARGFGLALDTDPDLNELDFGEWSGCSFDELRDQPLWESWNLNRDHVRPPGGETFAEAQSRVVRYLERLNLRHVDTRVVAVSHADLIKAALAWALGLPLAFHARFEISPASVSRILLGPSGPRVVCLNQRFDR